MLLAWHQASTTTREHPLQWLDLMAACGIRGLRWGLEAAGAHSMPPEIVVNDADGDRWPLLEHNLKPLAGATCSSVPAETLLCQAQLEGRRFDLIDLDAFGHPGALIQPVLQVLAPDGILAVSYTHLRAHET